jgi:CRP-like cAMP-binding protein
MTNTADQQTELIPVALKKAYVFSHATPEEITAVAMVAQWISLAPQTQIVKEGQVCDSLYVLAGGRLVVKEAVSGNMELVIARITPGDLVGELGFIDRQGASASVRSDGPADVVRLSYDGVRSVFNLHPALETKFLKELVHIMAARVRRGNAGLRETLLGTSISRL